MEALSQIKQAIRTISKGAKQVNTFVAMVKEVNSSGDSCTISLQGLDISDVRLRPIINQSESQLLITPKKDSAVLVTDLSGGELTQLVIIGYSQIERIDINDENSNAPIKICINGGNNAGLIKIKELTKKLNELVRNVQDIREKFSMHFHTIPGGAVPGQTPPMVPPWTDTIKQFTDSDYEDTNITH